METVESVREKIPLEEQKSIFLENKIAIYKKIINLLFKLHKINVKKNYEKEAFHFAERAKARALYDILQESKLKVGQDIDPSLASKREEIFHNISKIETTLHSQDLSPSARNQLFEELKAQEEKLEEINFELRIKNPALANLIYPQPVDIHDLQEKILKENDILIEYSLGEEHSYLWVIEKNEISIHQLPAQNEIEEVISQYLALLKGPPLPGVAYQTMARKLYDILLKPLGQLSQNDLNLIIIPDSILHYLPFETLIVNTDGQRNHCLVEDANISYAPSASILSFILKESKKKIQKEEQRLLAFGDPVFGKEDKKFQVNEDIEGNNFMQINSTQRGLYENLGFDLERLPFSVLEINKIASFFPKNRKTIYTGIEAKEERVKREQLTKYSHIHFATHGIFDERHPNRSCLVLTLDDDPEEDGFLQMNEIFNLKLDSDLVVLSACQTGEGKLRQGEGLIGLTRAFFYAGTESIVASLWEVDDYSTAELFGKFYGYLHEGKSKGEALRKAKLDFIKEKNPRLRHPFYWAPFVIIGNK